MSNFNLLSILYDVFRNKKSFLLQKDYFFINWVILQKEEPKFIIDRNYICLLNQKTQQKYQRDYYRIINK